MKKTKIICSLGPSSYDKEVIKAMVLNGMDTARINFSHAKKDDVIKVIEDIKEVRKQGKKLWYL